MFGLTIDKFLVILVIALVIIGPDKLPLYAQKLGELVKQVRRFVMTAKDRVKDEMGDEFDDVDWKQLDPRQYDPRRIIREALEEDLFEEKANKHAAERQERIAKSARERYQPKRSAATEGATATAAAPSAANSTAAAESGAAIAAAAFAKHRIRTADEPAAAAHPEPAAGFYFDTEAT